MNLKEKVDRSKNNDKIDFTQIACHDQDDALVRVQSSDRLAIQPNWTIPGDFEGDMYADYRVTHPEYDGVYVRSELLKRLVLAANSLDKPYQLVVRAGHRPLEVQKRLLHDCIEQYKKNNPGVTEAEALTQARIFVSDPAVELPPHCAGAAVDVDVRDVTTNAMVDFGSYVNENNGSSYLYADGLTEEQKANRQMLLQAMLAAGLASCYSEWWHYSYGDQVWAWFYGKKDCLYGLIEV